MRAWINCWAKSFIMIVNMSKYDKIIHITNFDDYMKVCNKLHDLWYAWSWSMKLTSYVDFFRTDWTITLYTYVGEKWVCHWINREEAISARKFLNVYDL